MLDCNVYILIDKENKAVKAGITRKHPDVRTTNINKEATKYKFVLHKFETMSIEKARWVEGKLLTALESMGGVWIEDDDFGGSTEVATLNVTDTMFDISVVHLSELLCSFSAQDFKEVSHKEVEQDSTTIKIPLTLLSAKYLHNTATNIKIQLDPLDKIVLAVLKENPDADQYSLAEACGISRRSVIRSIQHTSSCGFVEVTKARSSGGALYNSYVVHEVDGITFAAYK